MTQKVFPVAGARPNFMKIAPIIRATKKHSGLTPVQNFIDNR